VATSLAQMLYRDTDARIVSCWRLGGRGKNSTKGLKGSASVGNVMLSSSIFQ
jgi:hypothetical protein